MRDISPLITLINISGISSKEVDRKILPKCGVRSFSGNKLPFSSLSFVIDLNLYNLNNFPCNPGRSTAYSTGEPRLIFTKIATMTNTHQNRKRDANESKRSSPLFIYLAYIRFVLFLPFLIFIPFYKVEKFRHLVEEVTLCKAPSNYFYNSFLLFFAHLDIGRQAQTPMEQICSHISLFCYP